MSTVETERTPAYLTTLPGDDVRQIMWRFADRYDLQMLVQSSRTVARGPVARVVAEGGRNTHEWSAAKQSLLQAYDDAGLTTLSVEPEYGGFITGPKNMAMALAAFELAWVDGGAATSSLATHLALAPIHEKGTAEQCSKYMGGCVPPRPGENRPHLRGAFALTEPIPFAGVQTRSLAGKVRVEAWNEGEEPLLRVEKRGRFITNMDFANFVTAAVDSDDERIKGSCMVILEEGDPGTFDRGAATRKLVHQLSSTRDPIFNMVVPASRIIGGYTIQDGVIVPNVDHNEVIRAVFRRTRVTVGLMTAAKLVSAIEPVIRYHRNRFRGGPSETPGSPRYELGLQQKEDVLHRLIEVWATGEASASLGFATARFFDDFDPLDHRREEIFETHEIPEGRAGLRALNQVIPQAVEFVELSGRPAAVRDGARYEELAGDELIEFLVGDALANVLCPACKLWNTGHGATMMREAVSLMGGYGITEDCPGFLGQKWMDAQLEATYEGPEAVQRRQLSLTMTNEIFLAQFGQWILELRRIAGRRPGTGACTLASAMELWLWTIRRLQKAKDADGKALYGDKRQGVTFPLADALCWLLASRFQILDVLELEEKTAGSEGEEATEAMQGLVHFFSDLAHTQAARAAGEVDRICTDLLYGYNRHPHWDSEYAFPRGDLESLETVMPGIAACSERDAIDEDGSHAPKAGPCVRFAGMETFQALRAKLGGCGTGSGLAKDRAAHALANVMIPEAQDYPA
ncbi:MAG: acyl-CoA dehydrogenase family protein [Candidatus Eisenbacteria bacterium]|uniref:Acyl-CoA/acyl-ACP dehydrogenase n=1 Tax=Eiseniibacteriota bacterium TaxID=2212470 RepID=A0A956LWF3_UNCEI|nr:acyl-CoA/acyl-ACP dehydrogenase [Candidatus Eisenbacteria bacterium]